MVLVTRQACRPSGPSSEPWPLSFTPPNGESAAAIVTALMPTIPASIRSEEHTSELQSQSNLVCRLLLEKKKTLPAWRRVRHDLDDGSKHAAPTSDSASSATPYSTHSTPALLLPRPTRVLVPANPSACSH